jgi:ATP-binding cassette subfamily B (MDR/TAP) protein 1
MTAATNAANYIFWLEQLQPTIRETEENKHVGPEDWKDLELENLYFSYPLRPQARVLRGLNLQVCIPFSTVHASQSTGDKSPMCSN